MTEERRGCWSGILFSFSCLNWVIMAFVDMRSWVAGLIATALMVVFYCYCERECGKLFPLIGYVLGVATVLIMLTSMGLPWWCCILCSLLMPALCPVLAYYRNWVKQEQKKEDERLQEEKLQEEKLQEEKQQEVEGDK